jgi:Molybdate transporter of MFS superfamily
VAKEEEATADDAELVVTPPQLLRNRFDRMEWAGAFGDLGTLIPFVLAYVTVMGLDPLGVLLGFGVCMVASGLWYRTPFPVQPMKALGVVATTQAAQTATVTPQAVYGAGLVTGVLWPVLGLTGATRWVTNLVSGPVVVGIVLGLGLGFMIEGIKLMAVGWLLSAAVLLVALLLLSSRRVPAMFVYCSEARLSRLSVTQLFWMHSVASSSKLACLPSPSQVSLGLTSSLVSSSSRSLRCRSRSEMR